uniref:Uncharacterized protein n=1 Tax=Phlebotomus papatasi TaxID=29031 RepID=A0A1B0D061_PHLPP
MGRMYLLNRRAVSKNGKKEKAKVFSLSLQCPAICISMIYPNAHRYDEHEDQDHKIHNGKGLTRNVSTDHYRMSY